MHSFRAMWRRLCATAVALACCSLASRADASQARPLTLGELVTRSDATVLGHTLKTHSFWQGTRILTVAQIAVDELWSGSLAGDNVVDVVTLGGAVGEWGQRVDGAAQFSPYGRMVLHLARVGHEYTPTGMAQGLWRVDSLWGDGGRVSRQAPITKGHVPASPSAHFSPMPVDTVGALREAVKLAARQKASARP